MDVPITIAIGAAAAAASRIVDLAAESPHARTVLLGLIKAKYVRATFSFIGAIAFANGVQLSSSDHSHKALTYGVWYGLGAVMALGVIVTTILMDRPAKTSPGADGAMRQDSTPGSLYEDVSATHAGDQEALNDLLHLVSRESVAMIARQDFVQSWPHIMSNPVHVLVNEYAQVENEFSDPLLEQARMELLVAADEFAEQEALHGFVSRFDDRRRIPGYTVSEAEGIPEREEAILRHASAIASAARRFLEAHDNLIRIARGRGYSVEGLRRGRHPRLLEIDAIYNE